MPDWVKTGKPADYDETGGFLWSQLTGVFKNTPPGSVDHIDNCDGSQAAWLFAVPGVGLYQEGTAAPGSDGFQARYEADKAYRLTVALLGGGGNMAEGASIELALYYRDDAGQAVTLASTNVAHSASAFPVHTRFSDYGCTLPPAPPGDPRIGRAVGLRIVSSVDPALQGGYWDVDNIRLETVLSAAVPVPVSAELNPAGTLLLRWDSRPGYAYRVRISPDLSAWSDLPPALPGTGQPLQKAVPTDGARAFLEVLEEPVP